MPNKRKPIKRDKAASMKKICDAALEVFSTHTYETASTKKIAEKAGLNSALIFNYFGSKLGLFKYVFNEVKGKNTGFQIEYQLKESFEEELKTFAEAQTEMLISRREALRSMLFLRNYENTYYLDGAYSERGAIMKSRIEYFISLDAIDTHIDIDTLIDSFIHMLDGMILTFCIYSNESKEYLMEKISPLIEIICKDLKSGAKG